MLRQRLRQHFLFGMDGFDMLAMGISLFDPSNALVEFNRKLHSNALYDGFQIAVNALAVSVPGRHRQ